MKCHKWIFFKSLIAIKINWLDLGTLKVEARHKGKHNWGNHRMHNGTFLTLVLLNFLTFHLSKFWNCYEKWMFPLKPATLWPSSIRPSFYSKFLNKFWIFKNYHHFFIFILMSKKFVMIFWQCNVNRLDEVK